MVFTDLIEKKKRGLPLSTEEIDFFISGMMDGSIPDYQVSAFLMAVVLKGMVEDETFATSLDERSYRRPAGR